MLYTKASAATILGVKSSQIKTIELVENSDRVNVNGDIEIPKEEFMKEFVAKRKRSSVKVSIAEHPFKKSEYIATSSNDNVFYSLVPQSDRVTCTCMDYQHQVERLGRGCCKHGYALLAKFGYDSLKDYVLAISKESA